MTFIPPMTRILTTYILIITSALVFGLCGCASSAKQDAAASAEYIRSQNYAATNTPLPMNLNYNQPPPVPGVSMDSPKAIQTGFVRPVVSPLTNGCSQIVWKGMTNIACPQPSVTNITLTWDWLPGIVYTVQSSPTLLTPKENWPVVGTTETNVMTISVTSAAAFFVLSAALK